LQIGTASAVRDIMGSLIYKQAEFGVRERRAQRARQTAAGRQGCFETVSARAHSTDKPWLDLQSVDLQYIDRSRETCNDH